MSRSWLLEQRSSLAGLLSGTERALPIAREIYTWFSEQTIVNKIAVLVDELRRWDIAARERVGYVAVKDGEQIRFNTTTWAELFFPRWGWISLYRESMAAGLPFGESMHDYLPLPMGGSFPQLYSPDNVEIQGLIRPSLRPGDYFSQ